MCIIAGKVACELTGYIYGVQVFLACVMKVIFMIFQIPSEP